MPSGLQPGLFWYGSAGEVSSTQVSKHSHFGVFLYLSILLLPAVMSLFFAWALWLDKKHLEKTQWRARAFRLSMVAATAATVLTSIDGARFVDTQLPATGFFLVGNWAALLLWLLALLGAFAGRGGRRVSLLCSSVFLFVGVYGMFIPP
jgi:hypothetical protein